MNLVWKLLYQDVLPVFTQQDSFMKADYLIMSKKIGMGNTISGRSNTFSGAEMDDVSDQKFVKKIGKFTSTEYKVDANFSSKVFLMVSWMFRSRIGNTHLARRWFQLSSRVPILICITSDSPRAIRFLRSVMV